MSYRHRRGFRAPDYVYAPQPALSLEEAPVPPNVGFHDPIVCKPTNYFANYDCNLGSSVSSTIHNGAESGTDHRSGIRASDDILVVPEPNWRWRAEEHDVRHLQTSKFAHHHATPDYSRLIQR